MTAAKLNQLKTDGQLRRPKGVNAPPPPAAPTWDFHRIVSSFADYPHLLRALGLVIDCVLPQDSVIEQQTAASPAGTATGVMGLALSWGGPHNPADDSTPRTAWQADKQRFTTRARTPDHERGMLRLRHSHDRWHQAKDNLFDVYQVDPDGSALKTVDFVLSAQRLVAKSLTPLGKPGDVTYTTGDKQPVAALRSGGLGVSRHGRAQQIAQSAASAALKNPAIAAGGAASTGVVLFTEDVLRGYRVDVQALPGGVPGPWRSLCRRDGRYRFVGGGDELKFPEDEGYVKGASTTSAADGGDPDDHYLHESLFRWTGWSLVAPRPGRTLRESVDPTSGVQAETPDVVTDEAASGNGMAVTFSATKGSLPRLRFGVAYRFRARVVDLAGNSLGHDDPSLENDIDVTEPVVYSRFEPVDPPALVHRARVSEGESLERLVIRSNWNKTTADYLTSDAFAAATALPASSDFEYTAENERHVVPPKSSQLQCEHHSLFDPFFGDPAKIKEGYAIAAREAGTLYDALPGSQVELITPASLANVATTNAVPPRLPSPENPTGDRLAPGQYVIDREAQALTPYLPDGVAGGLAVRAMPGHTLPGVTGPMTLGPSAAIVQTPTQELVLLAAYGGEWPDSRGLRIVLAERSATLADPPCSETFADAGAPTWDEDARVLTLFVPKGRIVRLRYASFIDKRFLDDFGLPSWTGSAGSATFVRQMGQLGSGWMMTPYRPLVLVHATQQPVCEPEFLTLGIARNLGDQHARLSARVRMHGPSTGKFEIEATWKEWVDDVDRPGPELIASRGQLGEVLLAENYDNLFSLSTAIDQQQPPEGAQPRARGDRHEFGDTKFRLIEYTMRATTRFREYLPEALYSQRDAITRVGPIADGPTMQVGTDDDPGAPVLQISNAKAKNVVVPSTAPPDDPRVVYVVPTFRWSTSSNASGQETTRLGNGLRVWLERPWFSSGNGELLGVVLLGEDRRFTDITSELVPLVTQWGLDPLWDTALPSYRTRVSDFPARVTFEDVPLRELPNTTVRVVGHRVRWDQSRRLWYCDIELNPGASYMPFVRLALVRYQANALADAKISKVVLAEFSQVLPRRRAVFSRTTGASTPVVSFSLHGVVPQHGPMKFPLDSEYQDISFPPPLGSPGETGRNRAEVVLQAQDPNVASDLGWSDVQVLGSSLLPAPAPPPPPQPQPVPTTRPPAIDPRITATTVSRITRTTAARQTLAGRVDLATSIDLTGVSASPAAGAAGALSDAIVARPELLIDPAIWQATFTLPQLPAGPHRIAVREYERYYTDRTVPEVRAGATRRRRVIEERLVYATYFDL
jgi:hypothetical protein